MKTLLLTAALIGQWIDAPPSKYDWIDTTPVAPVVPPSPPPKKKGVVRVRTSKFCSPCQVMKSDVKDYDGLEFQFVEVPFDGTVPLPFLEWDTPKGTQRLSGWPGLNPFIDYYNETIGYKIAAAEEATPVAEVKRVLKILNPKAHEVFVDYGCGDGRWLVEAARTYRCLAVGIELNHEQAERARQAAVDAGVADKVKVYEGDVLTTDVEAHVGVAYLYPELVEKLKPKLLKLTRFATYMHPVSGVSMQQVGDSFIYQRGMAQQVYQQPYAQYGGQMYSAPVCNNPNCKMCNSIRAQLGWR